MSSTRTRTACSTSRSWPVGHGLTPPPIRSHRLIVGRASLSQAMLAKKLGQRWAKKDLLLYFNRMMRLENLYGSNKQVSWDVGTCHY